jgi:hypothetical protein
MVHHHHVQTWDNLSFSDHEDAVIDANHDETERTFCSLDAAKQSAGTEDLLWSGVVEKGVS